jgi:cytoplasmic tRNA 2-thiolation protein 1
MTLLNERYDYGLDLHLLSIDEGISGYRDDSLLTVQRNSEQYKLPLKILSYSDLYQGWTMDKVVRETGKKGNCTYCGVFRRKALDLGGDVLEVDHIVTGHNADDVAETVLMNGELVLKQLKTVADESASSARRHRKSRAVYSHHHRLWWRGKSCQA